MAKAGFVLLFIVLSAQFCPAQSNGPSTRYADPFHGHIKTIRVEGARLKRGSGGELIESAAILEKLISYSDDGLTRTAVSYDSQGSVIETRVETYLPDGKQAGGTLTSGDGIFVARWAYEYDWQGHQISETRYNADGSVKEKVLRVTRSEGNVTTFTRFTSEGAPVDVTAVKSSPVASTSITTRADGSRSENNLATDKSGTHQQEWTTYKANGSVDERGVTIADKGRIEYTYSDGAGKVLNRTLQTREYDSFHNLIKDTHYRWNTEAQRFDPLGITYNKIVYRD
jgi:YD repeat-containing protein